MTKSRSAVIRDPQAPYSIEVIELEDPGPREALVRVSGVGMCHTDLIGRGGLLGEGFMPAVLGHEGAGVVERVGSGVTAVAPGDHVVLSFDSCGGCPACLSGSPAYCASFELLNLSGRRGDGSRGARDDAGAPVTSRWFAQSSFGQYCLATERNMVTVAEDQPLEQLGPLGCGIQTGAGAVLNQMRLAAGQSLAVFGAGAVGLSAVMAAKLAGASEIAVVDINPARLELAASLGATRVVDGRDTDVVKAVTGTGGGLDFSFDTTGVAAVMGHAINVLTRPGTCVLVGAGMDNVTVYPATLAGKSLTYCYEGAAVPQLFIPKLIGLWRQGLFPFDQLIKAYPLDGINQAEADAAAGTVVKPVLVMS